MAHNITLHGEMLDILGRPWSVDASEAGISITSPCEAGNVVALTWQEWNRVREAVEAYERAFIAAQEPVLRTAAE